MNTTTGAYALITAALLGAAACTTTDVPNSKPVPAQTAVTTTTEPPTTPDTSRVTIQSGKLTRIEFLGQVFRIKYTAKNTTKVTSDLLISFEYRDKTGTRIGDSVDSVEALTAGQTAKATFDAYADSAGFKLSDVDSVRVTKVDSWPSK